MNVFMHTRLVATALAVLGNGCAQPLRNTTAQPRTAMVALDQSALADLEAAARQSPAAALYEDALRGDAAAQRRLGMMYAAGDGLPRNLTAAVDWLRRAAEQDDCGAQHELGLLYLGGSGLPYDIDAAAFWLRRAAERLEDCTS